MSSPPRRKPSNSPIRFLDEKASPYQKKLHTIAEEDIIEAKSRAYNSGSSSLMAQNYVLAEKMRNYADLQMQSSLENSQLRRENQLLREKNYISASIEQDRLQRQLMLKDAELQKIRNDMVVLKEHYQRDIEQAQVENHGLRNQILLLEKKSHAQIIQIKDRYSVMAVQDSNLARKAYLEDLRKVMGNLQTTKTLLSQKENELNQLTAMSHNFSKEYSANLEQLVSENNVLRNQLMITQINKNNEVRQAQTKKELQKSRTKGLMNYCKENNAFMEKQVKRLGEQLLEKTITIEGFTKESLKQKKDLELTEKRYEQKIEKMQRNYEEKIRDMEEVIRKTEKHHKEEMGDVKKNQMELIQTIARIEHEKQTLKRQLQQTQSQLKHKIQELQEAKNNLSQLHEEHARQISKVMTDSRVKRRSMKNLSSVSSLKEISEGSPRKALQRQSSLLEQEDMSARLHIVPEEMTTSRFAQNVDGQEDDDVEIKQLVLHYEQMIQDLKKDKQIEMGILNNKIDKLNESLRSKQQEVLEILQRFSPLMEYKLNEGSLQKQRKEKIEKHYKADVDLLDVMLKKYEIAALKK